MLALRPEHPFWRAQEDTAAALADGQITLPAAGFAVQRVNGLASLLSGGQDARQFRGAEAKYGGFSYAAAFGFSVPSDASAPQRPEMVAMESGLAVSRDGQMWLRRGRIRDSGIRDGLVWGRWSPEEGVEIQSWSGFADSGWHLRLHVLESDAPLHVIETGFAIDATAQASRDLRAGAATISLMADGLTSALVAVSDPRQASQIKAAPNTNLLRPRTVIPQLAGAVAAGRTVLLTGVFGGRACDFRWVDLSASPLCARLREIADRG